MAGGGSFPVCRVAVGAGAAEGCSCLRLRLRRLPELQPGVCRSRACTQSKGNMIWPYVLGMNMKNAFKCVLYFFTVTNRHIFTFYVLAFL